MCKNTFDFRNDRKKKKNEAICINLKFFRLRRLRKKSVSEIYDGEKFFHLMIDDGGKKKLVLFPGRK